MTKANTAFGAYVATMGNSKEHQDILIVLIKNLIAKHKTPWKIEPMRNSRSFLIRDDWGKIVISFGSQELMQKISTAASKLVELYEEDAPENTNHSILQEIWKGMEKNLI